MSEPNGKKAKPAKSKRTRLFLIRHGATVLTAEDRCASAVASRQYNGA
jgi:hypothetical protein